MLKYILILTLSNAGTMYEGKAIHSAEYSTQDACENAGKLWKSSLHNKDQQLATFVCTRSM